MAGKRKSAGSISVAPSGQSESVTIRQIKNGYLICKSGAVRGKYKSVEEFSPHKPVISASVATERPRAAERERRSPKPAGPREVGFLRTE